MKKAPPDYYRAVAAGERHSGATVWGPLFFCSLALSGLRNRRIRGLVVAVAAVVTRGTGTVCASTGEASEVADCGAYALLRDFATFDLFTVGDKVHTRRLQFTRH